MFVLAALGSNSCEEADAEGPSAAIADFLRTIDREVPKGLEVHLILDNYSTHKAPQREEVAREAPARSPPLHADLELVAEPRRAVFGKLTDKAIRRGIFASVPDLIAAIEDYLKATNDNPQPFKWTATAEQIREKVRRGRVTLDAITN